MPYDPHFLQKPVPLPKLTPAQVSDTLLVDQTEGAEPIISHLQYAVAMCRSRRLAWYSVAHIDAALRKEVKRDEMRKTFLVEPQLHAQQVIEKKWYDASFDFLGKQLIDQGHLTPADIMEWGEDHAAAKTNAEDTFFFTNAVPQHKDLNRKEWKNLEKFISNECIKTGNTRLLVFTGNLLAEDDPTYLPLKEEAFTLRIPIRFWKVIYYINQKGKLCRIGFVMGQKELMEQSGLVEFSAEPEKMTRAVDDAFTNLGKNKTFCVAVKQIETWTKHKFSKATETNKNLTMIPLTHHEIDLSSNKKDAVPHGISIEKDGHLEVMEGLEL